MAQIVPFVCRECRAEFPATSGFICSVCLRLLCLKHRAIRFGAVVCRPCARKSQPTS